MRSRRAAIVLSLPLLLPGALHTSAWGGEAAYWGREFPRRLLLGGAGAVLGPGAPFWLAGGLGALAVQDYEEGFQEDAARDRPIGDADSFGSALGSGVVLFPAAALAYLSGVGLGRPALRDTGRRLLEALSIGGLLSMGLKEVVQRTRPNGGSRSFPSGHATVSFAFAGVLAFERGPALGVPALLGASLVGWSRIQEGKHFPSDVLFGAGLGLAAARGTTALGQDLALLPVPGGAILAWRF